MYSVSKNVEFPQVRVASRVVGTGMNVPPRVVTNKHFESYLDTSDEWIRERTGISERRWAADGVGVSELAEPAARTAIERANLTVGDIDGIVFATVTSDYTFPSSACLLQKRLGIKAGFAFDINAVCSGFVYALVCADSLIASGQCKNVIVVGADIYSRIINQDDRGTCVLFGDGAGAVVVSAAPETGSAGELRGIYDSFLGADGSQSDILYTPSGSAVKPISENVDPDIQYLQMEGREVFKLAVRKLGQINEEILERNGVQIEAVNHFISHQANQRILQSMAQRLGVTEDRVPSNVDKYGNTSAASIPILLAEEDHAGRLKTKDLVLLSAFGAGVTWGAVLLRW